MMIACYYNHVKIVQLLVEKLANVGVRNKVTCTHPYYVRYRKLQGYFCMLFCRKGRRV